GLADAARPRTDAYQRQERRRPSREALSAVGAAGLFADGMQRPRTHEALDGVEVGQPKAFLPDPLRSPDGQDVHSPGGTIHVRTLSLRASVSEAFDASSREA